MSRTFTLVLPMIPDTYVIVLPFEHKGNIGYVYQTITREVMTDAVFSFGPMLVEMLDEKLEELKNE